MSLIAFSAIPLMVYVLPLLVCPYAKIVAAERKSVEKLEFGPKSSLSSRKVKPQIKLFWYIMLPFIPLSADKATSLAPSS